jgi:hypothetical protein
VPQDKADIEDPMAWLAFATDGSESCAVYVTTARPPRQVFAECAGVIDGGFRTVASRLQAHRRGA